MYVPTPSATLDQGVILKELYFYGSDVSRPGVVVTPTCDIEQGKCDYVQVCALWDAWEVVDGLLHGAWSGMKLVQPSGALAAGPLGKDKRSNLEGQIRRLVTQQFSRYHWLNPPPGTTVPRIVDFQQLASIGINEVAGSTIVAELRSPYREQLCARYAAYMGRVGTEDPSSGDVSTWIQQGIDRLFPSPPKP